MSTSIKSFTLVLATCLLGATTTRTAVDPRPGVDWPSFRGIRGNGVADGFKTATTWDVPQNKGVRWKAAIPGLGHSSPIVWGNRVCLTTAISGKPDAGIKIGLYGDIASVPDDTVHTWKLMCLDKKSGKVLVDQTIHSGVPIIKRHLKSTHANTTLATDGTYLVAMLGSEGLHTFDLDGKLLWKKDLGVLDSGFYMVPAAQWEFSSSPVIHNGVIVVQADVQKNSFLAAFDAKTGKELWRTPRQDVPTFSTPTIHEVGGRTLVLVNGMKQMGAYDFKTGAEVWKLGGGGDIPVPTPIVGHGLVYFTNSHGGRSPIFAVRESASGDIVLGANETSNAQVAWSLPSEGAYLITPLLYGDLLYSCKPNGVLVALDAKTGQRAYEPQRLATATTAFTASIVAADGKLYLMSEDGDVYVVKAGRTFELLATNPLGDTVLATPAVSEGVIYFRTGKSLIAVQ
jgi:outer membrane protein assembly factor BamB